MINVYIYNTVTTKKRKKNVLEDAHLWEGIKMKSTHEQYK